MPLVGRRAELEFLADAFAPMTGPRTVVIVGEAGVGKTRLVAEAAARAGAAGTKVLTGACLPLTDSVPFLPVTEALRGVGIADGEFIPPPILDRFPSQVRWELSRLIPAWGPEGVASPPEAVDGWQRARLFSALRDLLAALAAKEPHALVVEDVHWADETTLDFLVYLAAVDGHGLLPMVMTCREEELLGERPVGRWLAELERRAGIGHLRLGRLSAQEVAEQVRGLLGDTVPASLIEEIFRRGGGNAFFTERLTSGRSAAADSPLPRDLAALLVAQADAVSDDGRAVLVALSVVGRDVDERVLTEISGVRGLALRAAVRELTQAGLVDPHVPAGWFRLRHALVAEAVTRDMFSEERRARHAVVASALTALDAATGTAEIAAHRAAAGQTADEMPLRVVAAREAEHVYAYREAATHWRRVIMLWPQLPAGANPPGLDLAAAYLRALAALDRCGDTRVAAPLAEQALRALDGVANPRQLALLYEKAAMYRSLDDWPAAVEPLETAIGLLANLPIGREHAIVLLNYADIICWMDRDDDAVAALQQALKASRAAQAIKEEIKILSMLGNLALHAGDIDAGQRRHTEAAALAERHGDPLAVLELDYVRAETALVLGRLEEAATAARVALQTAQNAGLAQHVSYEFLAFCLFEALAELGRPGEAAPFILAATVSPPTSSASHAHMARAQLDMLAGDLQAAIDRSTAIESVTHAVNLDVGYLIYRGAIDLWANRPADALRRIAEAPHPVEPTSCRGFTGPILTTAIHACADLAETARARKDAAAEQTAQHAARDWVTAHAAMQPDPFAPHPYWTTAPAEAATWAAELTRVAGSPDPDAWSAAADAWLSLGRPHRVGYARWRQAEALLRTSGRTASSAECLRQAALAAHTHIPLLTEIRSLARLARVDIEPAPDHSPSGTAGTPRPYGLTPRETTVLRLLVEGRTNAEIGSTLYIDKKTASVHVTNILRKLGVRNRTEAAALAQRAGLL